MTLPHPPSTLCHGPSIALIPPRRPSPVGTSEPWALELPAKLGLLIALVEAASASEPMRAWLHERMERLLDAQAERAEVARAERDREAERKATARAQKEEERARAAAVAADGAGEDADGAADAEAGASAHGGKAGQKRKRPKGGKAAAAATAEDGDGAGGSRHGAKATQDGEGEAALPPPVSELEGPGDPPATSEEAGGGKGIKGHASDRAKAREQSEKCVLDAHSPSCPPAPLPTRSAPHPLRSRLRHLSRAPSPL